MKKLTLILIGLLAVGTLSAQVPNTFRYPITIGMPAPEVPPLLPEVTTDANTLIKYYELKRLNQLSIQN